MPRYALKIDYHGGAFAGWQRQAGQPSVQEAVENALRALEPDAPRIAAAGRTDAGVHATAQVAHCDLARDWDPFRLSEALNWHLKPAAVAIVAAARVADDFHARYGALGRRYRYTILNRAARPALDARYVAWERQSLDAEAMHRASQALLGEQDFSAFRTIACQARTPFRNVHSIEVRRIGEQIVIDIEANAFLHHMVRNIVGSLLPIGRGEQAEDWMARLLAGRDRSVAGPTAAACGLCFIAPVYPVAAGLPGEASRP